MPKKYRWTHRSLDEDEAVARLQRELNGLPEALARTLVLRGVASFEDARRFFRPDRSFLHDPFLMQDMDAAADRVARAIERGERVLVYGDYDVDGTTATALMTDFLRSRGVPADFFIPDRFEDGYGLSERGIDYAAERGAGLIIALDCGITAGEEAAYARQKGLDLIICDHHTAGEALPEALAVLDPKRPDCDYPFTELSGCGVGFKLVQAALTRLGRPADEAFCYADLLAVSIASDIVPVFGENRILLREGLDRLAEAPRPGFRLLARAAGLDLEKVSSSRIVFTIGPRINAAGRLDHARHAVDLLLAEDAAEAAEHAETLEQLNDERRTIDQQTTEQAIARAKRQLTARQRHALVLHQEDWHPGVIGIVASRVTERFYRPSVMLSTAGDVLKGSARSIAGVNIYEALTACKNVLIQFGGHDHAAGMTLAPGNLEAFRERFDEAVGEAVTPELLMPAIEVDARLDLEEIGTVDDRFWAVLKQFAPFGPANDQPIFHAQNLAVTGQPRTVGRNDKHLKFRVRPVSSTNGTAMDAIGFGLGGHLPTLQQSQREGRPIELLFSLEENTWRGRTSLQLKARDLRLEKEE